MKKWFIFSLIFFCICFITLNAYLIWKKDSKAEHTVYVHDWKRVQERNIIKTLDTKGILMPQEEYKVYFDDKDKEFLRFLVKEGDEVTAGTPLIEYATPELDQVRDTLESDISQAEGELSSIDEYIAKLSDYQASISSSDSSYAYEYDSVFAFEDDFNFSEDITDTEDTSTSNDVIISQIEQEIYKQELEKSKLEDKIFNYETQISLINEKSDSAMIISEGDGIVKDVNDQLGNPVVTIASTSLSIKGTLTEEQLKKVKVDMSFNATVSGEKAKLEGTIFDIGSFPENEPEIDKKNVYPFEAILSEQAEALPIGTTADVKVTLDQALKVPAVPRNAIVKQDKKTFLYFLDKNGLVNRKEVTTGLRSGDLQEIKEGTEIGQVVMTTDQSHNKSKFATTMQPTYLKKNAFKDLSSKEKWESFLIGVAER
ncbi:efflux RND transporter periplasmic adaptor subunit [Bacillus sp. J37]|uniref:efflux RND transporter periplasmic adaptor subunit n=1 Tax=Bacillus sp. J37 TaxID=935837 RepID=UPI00047942B9|nr:efflux RND transporter periplasmic adaptor subunit [Bacillus sp. J37]